MAIANKIKEAMDAGYSIDDIEKYLGSPGVVTKVSEAFASGYSPEAVDQYLATRSGPKNVNYAPAPNIQTFQQYDMQLQQYDMVAPKPDPRTDYGFTVNPNAQYTDQNYIMGTQPQVTSTEDKISESLARFGNTAVDNLGAIGRAGQAERDDFHELMKQGRHQEAVALLGNQFSNPMSGEGGVYNAARQKFIDESFKPVLYPAAMSGVPGAGLLAAPFFLQDIGKTFASHYDVKSPDAVMKAVGSTVTDFLPFVRTIEEYVKDPDKFWEQTKEMPGERIHEIGMSVLAAYMMGKGLIPAAKAKTMTMTEFVKTVGDAAVVKKLNENKMIGNTIVWEDRVTGKKNAGEIILIDKDGSYHVKTNIWDESGKATPNLGIDGEPWIDKIDPKRVERIIPKTAENLVPDLPGAIKERQYTQLFDKAEKGKTDVRTLEVLPGESIYTPDTYAALPPIRTPEQIKLDTKYAPLFDRAAKGKTDIVTRDVTERQMSEYERWWYDKQEGKPEIVTRDVTERQFHPYEKWWYDNAERVPASRANADGTIDFNAGLGAKGKEILQKFGKMPWEMTREEHKATYGAGRWNTSEPLEWNLPEDTRGISTPFKQVTARELAELELVKEGEKPAATLDSVDAFVEWVKAAKENGLVVLAHKNINGALQPYAAKTKALAKEAMDAPPGTETKGVALGFKTHEQIVKDAIQRGNAVPPEVLSQYGLTEYNAGMGKEGVKMLKSVGKRVVTKAPEREVPAPTIAVEKPPTPVMSFFAKAAPESIPDAIRPIAGAVSETKPETIIDKIKSVKSRFKENWTDPLDIMNKELTKVVGKEKAEDITFQTHIAKSKGNNEAAYLIYGTVPDLLHVPANSAAAIQGIMTNRPGIKLSPVTMLDVSNLLKTKQDIAMLNYYSIAKQFQDMVKKHPNIKTTEVEGKSLTVQDAATAQAYIEKNFPHVVDAHGKWMEVVRNNDALNVADGIRSQETMDMLHEMYPNHVPFYRDMGEIDATNHYAKGGGILNVPDTLKAYTGSNRKIMSPLESSMMNIVRDRAHGNRNAVARQFVELTKEHPFLAEMEGMTTVDGQPAQVSGKFSAGKDRKAFTVLIDGEKYTYSTTPEIYRAMQSMTPSSIGALQTVLSPFRALTQAVKYGATGANTEFFVKELARNPLYAAFTQRNFNPITDTAKGWKKTLTGDQSIYDMLAGGAGGEYLLTADRMDMNARIRDSIGKGGLMKYFRSVADILSAPNNAGEMSVRLGAYNKTLQETGSRVEAVKAARNAGPDFGKQGRLARVMNEHIPYFNAPIQGFNSLLKAYQANPKEFTAKGVGLITVPSVLIELVFGNDERYKKATDQEKFMNWIIPQGDSYIAIPKPPVLGYIFGTIPELAIRSLRESDPKFKELAAGALKEMSLPVGIPGLQQAYEWSANYNFFRDRPIVSGKYDRLPAEMQFDKNTSEFAKDMGAIFGLSPMKIDNTMSGLTAGLGRLGNDAYNAVRRPSNFPEKRIEDYPIIRSVYKSGLNNTQPQVDFWKRLGEVTKKYNGGNYSDDEYDDYKSYSRAAKELRKIRKEEQGIIDDPIMDAKTKRQQIDELAREQQRIVMEAIKK